MSQKLICVVCNKAVENEIEISRHECIQSYYSYIVSDFTGCFHPQKEDGQCLANVWQNNEIVKCFVSPEKLFLSKQAPPLVQKIFPATVSQTINAEKVLKLSTDNNVVQYVDMGKSAVNAMVSPSCDVESDDDVSKSDQARKERNKSRLSLIEISNLESLIEEVRKHKCLYDLTIPVKLRGPKHTGPAWKNVVSSLQIEGWDVNECKKKWKHLRDTFRRKIKKLELPSGSGAPDNDDKENDWPFMQQLMFLKEIEEQPLDEHSNLDQIPTKETNVNRNVSEHLNKSDESLFSNAIEEKTVTTQRQSTKRKKNNDELGTAIGKMMKAIESQPPIPSYLPNIPKPDSASGFFSFLQSKVMSLRRAKRNKLMEQFLLAVNAEESDNSDE